MLRDVASCQKSALPVLPALLQCPPQAGADEPAVHLTHEPALAHATALAISGRLNDEQTRCLQHTACWLSSEDQQRVSSMGSLSVAGCPLCSVSSCLHEPFLALDHCDCQGGPIEGSLLEWYALVLRM